MVSRKTIINKKDKPPRATRKYTVPFEKYSNNPPAVVDGKFVALEGSTVQVWRGRAAVKPQWHTCKVTKITIDSIEMWDETITQWFCIGHNEVNTIDIRLT